MGVFLGIALQALASSPQRYSVTAEAVGAVSSSRSAGNEQRQWGGGGLLSATYHLRPVVDDDTPRSAQRWIQRASTVTLSAWGRYASGPQITGDREEHAYGFAAAMRYDTASPLFVRARVQFEESGWFDTFRVPIPALGRDQTLQLDEWWMSANAAVGFRWRRFEAEGGLTFHGRVSQDISWSRLQGAPSPRFEPHLAVRALADGWFFVEAAASYAITDQDRALSLWLNPTALIGRNLSLFASLSHSRRWRADYESASVLTSSVGGGIGCWIGPVEATARYTFSAWGSSELTSPNSTGHVAQLGVTWRAR